MASLWIGGWGFFAIDEVNATVTHILEKNSTQISSVLKPGYVMHEKNGVKFMIKQEILKKHETFNKQEILDGDPTSGVLFSIAVEGSARANKNINKHQVLRFHFISHVMLYCLMLVHN